MILDELRNCLSNMEDNVNPSIELMDPNVAEIYSKSARAKVRRSRLLLSTDSSFLLGSFS